MFIVTVIFKEVFNICEDISLVDKDQAVLQISKESLNSNL